MYNTTLIPTAERENKTCFLCGSRKSVKYKVETQDCRVYLCNRCVATKKYYPGKESDT